MAKAKQSGSKNDLIKTMVGICEKCPVIKMPTDAQLDMEDEGLWCPRCGSLKMNSGFANIFKKQPEGCKNTVHLDAFIKQYPDMLNSYWAAFVNQDIATDNYTSLPPIFGGKIFGTGRGVFFLINIASGSAGEVHALHYPPVRIFDSKKDLEKWLCLANGELVEAFKDFSKSMAKKKSVGKPFAR